VGIKPNQLTKPNSQGGELSSQTQTSLDSRAQSVERITNWMDGLYQQLCQSTLAQHGIIVEQHGIIVEQHERANKFARNLLQPLQSLAECNGSSNAECLSGDTTRNPKTLRQSELVVINEEISDITHSQYLDLKLESIESQRLHYTERAHAAISDSHDILKTTAQIRKNLTT
jgi:hypothetical protein